MADRIDLTLTLDWRSVCPAGRVQHRDCYFAAAVDPAADRLPGGLGAALAAAAPGSRVEEQIPVEALGGDVADGAVVRSATARFVGRRPDGTAVTPRFGRFYPAALFRGLGPAGAGDAMRPLRYLGTEGGALKVDTRHPLAGRTLTLRAEVAGSGETATRTRAGPVDWTARLLDGPGLQAAWDGRPTDFVSDDSYARRDDGADAAFYAAPRMVAHLDRRAQAAVGDYYARILAPGATVLDLMSSLHSNLPETVRPARLVGLGLNAAEMRANAMLDGAVVADLNGRPGLPFADATFDAVLCTVSIDYLTRPREVFAEVRRVLRPGGTFAVTFSNRWFPPKVTRLWAELHPFERIGLVVGYFTEAGGFAELETWSLRGLPRPPDDRYAGQTAYADPVFAVTARRA